MHAQALVARNLRKLRVAQGISQEALALEAGVDRTYVGRLERGLENPTVAVLDRLAGRLGITIAEFFVAPLPGEPSPMPMRGGRRSRKAVISE
jgi:transcriptional regulator with XRE-family HTH domain